MSVNLAPEFFPGDCFLLAHPVDRWCKRRTYDNRQLQSVISTPGGHYCIGLQYQQKPKKAHPCVSPRHLSQ